MNEIKESDLVFIKPPPPPVGKVISIQEGIGQAEVEWIKGYVTTHRLSDLRKVADFPGEYQIKKELLP